MQPDADPGRGGLSAPRATYRLQLHAGFGFDAAAAVVGYLRDLGVSHVYLSPVLRAAPGSTHGYDVVDPTRVNPELGGEAGFERLAAAAAAAGLGLLLDIVPNHMAVSGRDNRWWWDVLRNGPASRWARYFDVDWEAGNPARRDTVLLPILGDHYGRALEAGRLTLQREGHEIVLCYFDHAAPTDPSTWAGPLLGAAERLDDEGGRIDLERLAGACADLPPAAERDPTLVAERQRAVDEVSGRLVELCGDNPGLAEAVDTELAALSADADRLDVVVRAQNYRLAWWRTAGENLDYRRFFDINDLAAIRAEEPQVFADSHWLVLGWLTAGLVGGLRIDHVDGLLDPARYLERLAAAAPAAWIVVEKILEAGETLPAGWPVAGTTGYDWCTRLGGLLTDRTGWERLVGRYQDLVGSTERFDEQVLRAKLEVLDGTLAADLRRLVARLAEVCERHRRHRDHTRRDLHDALAEVAASFPVYRTYVRAAGPGEVEAAASDVEVVETAVRQAGLRRPDLDDDLLALVRDVLLGRLGGEAEADVALRFQQLTGPVMAKAVEDTVFYRYLPLTSLNEVGGDPGRVEDDLDGFHAACAAAQRDRPLALLATSTHDTKRSEDVRARLSVLAEIPGEWADAMEGWWQGLEGGAAVPPDRNTAWLILQTLVGAWPIDADRAVAYVEKATREAKEHTSWTDPDPVYDATVAAFVRRAVDDRSTQAVVRGLVELVDGPGRAVGLAQKLLTLTAPGVPDLYQGTDLWDLSLVDPDNRRPVDFGRRRRLLAGLGDVDLAAVWAADTGDDTVKLGVVHAALRLRAEQPAWFGPGDAGAYQPLRASGPAADHLVAFARGGGAVTAASRWPLRLARAGGWRDTTLGLPAGSWADRLGGGRWKGDVAVGELLAGLPVALLARDGQSA